MSKKIFVGLTVLLAAGILLSGCGGIYLGLRAVRGSGKTTTKSYDFADFKRLEVGNAFVVDVTQGDGYSVEVTVDDNLVQYLDVVQRGDTVRITLQPGSYTNTRLHAQVTMPLLVSADFSGASQLSVSGLQSEDDLKLVVSGASQVRGDATAANLDLVLSGASQANLTGQAASLRVRASGASKTELADYAVETADVDLSGASSGTVNASGSLDVTLSGASTLTYLGNPELGRQSITGASSLKPQ